MLGHTFAELFGNIFFNFTRSVAERYESGGSDDVSNTSGYNPLEGTGKEWYAQDTGELIYQEYSNSKATSADYLTNRRSLRVQLINASSTSFTTHTPELSPEARDMAWKRLRPSISRTMLNSLCYGFLISGVKCHCLWYGLIYCLLFLLPNTTQLRTSSQGINTD